ncbi:glycosyltransferase [Croceicoccus sp. F390]|uniref:Glycosyltransferase n=1 Tax=Croceicoccus esteveae TaxID=3075597 RepID=A0ABU2ZGY4_9SPHN|nr:glycosyltransferase [Croceicoccus sp. F390]MDT0575861.1 glycosyltransferase [Croceicoccus sp. F390]
MHRPCDVVFVSRQRLVGRTNGSSAYLLDLAAAARRAGLACILVQPSPSFFGRMPVLRLTSDMEVFTRHHARGAVRLGRLLVALDPAVWLSAARGVLARTTRRAGLNMHWLKDRKAPYSIAVPWTDADRTYGARHVPDGAIVIADYIFQTEAFASLGRKPRATATIMHDLFHRRAELVAATGASDSVVAVSRKDELDLLARADLVIAIQQAEADFVAENLPQQPVMTVPMSFAAIATAQPGEADQILFVGSNTEPNIAGLKWFCENCWPTIRNALPEATLQIAGTVATGLAGYGVPAGARLLGMVADLDPLYSRAGVVISPLTFGSGLKIKLVEAMALGKAIVATSVTLQGVEEIAGPAVCQADDAAQFAAAVVSLAKDRALREKLGLKAIAVAEQHFCATATQDQFTAWLLDRCAGR